MWHLLIKKLYHNCYNYALKVDEGLKLRYILISILFILNAHAHQVQSGYWKSGETLLTFFEKHGIPQRLYYNLPKPDQESATAINSGTRYFTLHNDDGKLVELLLPISQELQIKVYYEDDRYHFTTKPISYTTISDTFVIELNNSPYYDIVKHTGLRSLADEFVAIFRNTIDFSRSIRKGDKLVISYEQNMRLGKPFGSPSIKMAMIETNKRPNYLFNYNDRYFNEDGIEIEGFYLTRPVAASKSWISSHFSPKRWHPILKRYRAHLGVDYAANTGTPIKAAAGGRIVSIGDRGGYGNTIEIDHGNGFRTLYAHMNGFRNGLQRGSRVSRGQTIGYVGSTGVSTGPHLHFELIRRGTRINPLNAVRIERDSLTDEEKTEFLTVVDGYKQTIETTIASNAAPRKIDILTGDQTTTLIARAELPTDLNEKAKEQL